LPKAAEALEKYSVKIAIIGSSEEIKKKIEGRTTSVRLGVGS